MSLIYKESKMSLHAWMLYVPAEGSTKTITARTFKMPSSRSWLNISKLPYCAVTVGPLSKSQDGSICCVLVHGSGSDSIFYQDLLYKVSEINEQNLRFQGISYLSFSAFTNRDVIRRKTFPHQQECEHWWCRFFVVGVLWYEHLMCFLSDMMYHLLRNQAME